MGEEFQDADSLDEPPVSILIGSLKEFESSMELFDQYTLSKNVPDDEKLPLFWQCVEQSKNESWTSIVENKQSFQTFPETVKFFRESFFTIKQILLSKKADVKAAIKNIKGYSDRGYFLSGIAFPCLMEFADGFFPMFLTCAHNTKCGNWEELRKKGSLNVLLTPSSTLEPDESFLFKLDSSQSNYGCGDWPGNLKDLDYLALFLKDKNNVKGDGVTKFWMPADKIVEGQPILMPTSFENFSLAEGDVPLVQQGAVSQYPVHLPAVEEPIRAVALHDLIGVTGMSGECVYTEDQKCLLVFRGHHSGLSSYLGVPLEAVKEDLMKKHGDNIGSFCVDTIPKGWQVEGFVESYLLLISTKTLENDEGTP